MNDIIPEARRIQRRLPGLVWAIPAAALIVVAYLAVNAMLERGVEVVLTVDDAAGVKRRDTPVTYKGVNVGKVTKIDLADDREHVELTLRLSRKVEPLLTTGTRFWIVGANPTIEDLSSLTAAVTGISIEMAPGPGKPTDHFNGLDHPPIVLPGTPGTKVFLETDQRGSIKPGSRITYHGDDAGKITDVKFVPPASFEMEAFVIAPYADELRDSSGFWMNGSVQVSLTSEGVSTNLPNAADLLSGSVAFMTPLDKLNTPVARNGARFILYADENIAKEGADGLDVLYEASFDAPTGALAPGAPVTLLGFRIGRVRSRELVVDQATDNVANPVMLAIHPLRLGLDPEDRTAADAFVTKLVELGYRLRLVQSPPIVGSLLIEFAKVDGKGKLLTGKEFPRIPTGATGDVSQMAAVVSSILDKVNRIPFEGIGQNISAAAAELQRTLASVEPEIGPTLAKVRGASDQVESVAASAKQVMSGEGAAQDTSLPGAIRQFTDAARAIRSFTDYMERHPEALLFGRPKDNQR